MLKTPVLVLLLMVVGQACAGLTIIGEEKPVADAPKALQEIIRPAAEIVTWKSQQGSTLKTTLSSWAKAASWDLRWSVVDGEDLIDYPLPMPVEIQGSFDQAAARFIRLYRDAKVPLHADINLAAKVIYITAEKKQ